jgi:hypothetical protein
MGERMGTYSSIRVVEEVFHAVALLTHDFSEDLGQSRDGREVVRSQGCEFPEGG